MKFSVLINNYNYRSFICECVDSALNQTRLADEIIVVDDGSGDDSMEVLQKHYGDHPRIKIVTQKNRGQTSAIATGFDHATGDIFCLLDADDRYKPNYLEQLESHYLKNPKVDLTFCRFDAFGKEPHLSNTPIIWEELEFDYDFGYTALMTYFGDHTWLGNVTSTLSLRREMANALDLHDAAHGVRTTNQGDTTLLQGVALLNGRKYYLHQTLVEYRLHDSNYSTRLNNAELRAYEVWYRTAIRVHYWRQRSHISEAMRSGLHREMALIPKPIPRHLELYRKIEVKHMTPAWVGPCKQLYSRFKAMGPFWFVRKAFQKIGMIFRGK